MYNREQLERILVAHVNKCLIPGGSTENDYLCNGKGCLNQIAFQEPDNLKAVTLFNRAATWFDRGYAEFYEHMDGVEFEAVLRRLEFVDPRV